MNNIHYKCGAFKIHSPTTGDVRLLLVPLTSAQWGGQFQGELLTRIRKAHASNARSLGVKRSDHALEADVSPMGVFTIQEAGSVNEALEMA